MTGSSIDTFDFRLHHGSHRHLLSPVPVSQVRGARVDAILVPAARPVESLNAALSLAKDLGCGLVVLCSQDVSAASAAAAGDDANVPVIAVDVNDRDYGLPVLQTAHLPDEFARSSDTSMKRNLALVLAKMAGWERVLFLDDDINGIPPSGARAAAALTLRYGAVGLDNKGHPDNSVVCHAYRELEMEGQAQFIGVGAMAVDAQSNRSFFPNIYNQDWMFMLGLGFPPPLAVTGRMKQEPYDPFADPDRARREEFGDCVAEGLYWLLDQQKPIELADVDHWTSFLKNRACFIDHLVARVRACVYEPAWKQRVLQSLQIARETSSKVTPEACVQFIVRWNADLATWQEFVAELPADLGVTKALEHLRWPHVFRSDRKWPELPTFAEDRLIFPNGWERAAADQQAGWPLDRSRQPSPLSPAVARGRVDS